jgi:hypothetical protein
MKKLIQSLAFAITTYGFWASGGWGVAPDTVLWNMYAQSAIAAYSDNKDESESDNRHPLLIEDKREAPVPPPPARLFVSAEGRYAIQQGWLTGAEYTENKIATHGEAVAMIMQIASLYPEDILCFGEYDPEQPLTQKDFAQFLTVIFCDLLVEGILEPDASGGFDSNRVITLAEMARTAYRLRGLNPYMP